MAVRSLDQIVGELGSIYNPQIQSIQQQKSLIGQGVEADINQAKAEQANAYEDILGGARRRGLGFSGIPLGEQAKYASTVFAPEVLRARQRGRQQELSLTDALNSIYENRRKYADSLRQQDVANDQWNQTFAFEKEKYAKELRDQAEQRAAAARAAAASYGGGYVGGGTSAPQGPAPKMVKRQDGGFNFTDASGRPISAAVYSQQTGTPIGELLRTMAQQGDTYAGNAYRWIQSVQNSDMWKRRGMQLAQKNYGSLFWGVQ